MDDHIIFNLLRAGGSLIDSTPSETPTNVADVLKQRLTQYFSVRGLECPAMDGTLEGLQARTATEALYVLECLQREWSRDDAAFQSQEGPSNASIGSRDLAQIRTLISIVFKWGVEPQLGRVANAIPVKTSQAHAGAKIIDLTGVPDDYERLSETIIRLLRLPYPHGPQTPLLQTAITSALLNKHVADLLKPSIVLGWLPKNLATDSVKPVDFIRPSVMQLLSTLSAAQTIAAFGSILSDSSIALPYARKSCGFLLSRQLLRPEGVAGLLGAMFGEEDISGEDAPLEKLEHVARLLGTVPASMKAEDYYGVIIPRLLAILSTDPKRIPPIYRRAIAFALSRMLASEKGDKEASIVSNILLARLHRPFLVTSPDVPGHENNEETPQAPATPELTPSEALDVLQTLLTNADPSPTFISSLLTPILPALYAILSHLETIKASDPALKESVRGFLVTWGRIVNTNEGIDALWEVVLGEGGEWKADVTGSLARLETTERNPTLSLFTPEDLRRAEEVGELDADANLFDLRPDPVQFVRYLKSIDRSDISSEVFVKLLEAYRELKAQPENDPLRTLLYLQLILQMQTQLATDDSASSILNKPDHILSFIKHALESAASPAAQSPKREPRANGGGLNLQDLRIVDEEEEPEVDEGDSDDEGPEMGASGDDEMVATSVNLLLSILEAHPDLSARTAPILNDIFSLLEPLSKDSSDTIRPLAREARMVMTARLASTSAAGSSRKAKKSKGDEETPQETYQKALKLLQDPLLPVRAHGLLLLRNLVSARRATPGRGTVHLEEPALDRALVPGILSIFLQSVQDDDSYMYLNAVQGLSAMVDGYGKEVLRGLVRTYCDGTEGPGKGGVMTQQEVDMRTRVGEALVQVVRRCGDALPAYVDILVPPLFRVLRTSDLPTTLRTSAISLLAQCAKTNSLALLPYATDLAEAMIDLLQVETVPATPRKENRPREDQQAHDREGEDKGTRDKDEDRPPPPPTPDTMDAQPTSSNSKFPPLRRAALHFLTLLIQACTAQLYDSDAGGAPAFPTFPTRLVRRAKTTLGYVAATDEDAVVRVMAREALEEIDQLAHAMVGA
ncbi:uncharacterized protein C8Q71DRAFT_731516 [Rhodofomes roseus]|uniref:RNA polymerase II assembly factor Rtp1 C-terminal domain-containing protein n=1 Tax=Rhodofomes roseus TaxID=34475 RepID=A0ABQ8KXX2_9APHY|nr:uncharacterized protein C8Q71DRAFT_731516 [Rhodofomes roseus]KAH9844158.1 hypothetical protein C8Q71DRAFT_731516 [Rhodofomes roseus]